MELPDINTSPGLTGPKLEYPGFTYSRFA